MYIPGRSVSELAGGGILLLMDFVTVESVIFTSLGIKINYVLIE